MQAQAKIEVIKAIIDFIFSNILGKNIKNRNLKYSSLLYLLLNILFSKLDKYYNIKEIVIIDESSLNYFVAQCIGHIFNKISPFLFDFGLIMLSIWLSIVISGMITHVGFLLSLFEQWDIYEKRDDRYYLKEEYALIRNKLHCIAEHPIIGYAIIFICVCCKNRLSSEFFDLASFLTGWIYLKAEYYSGKTYNEMLAVFQNKEQIIPPIRVIDNLVNCAMNTSIRKFTGRTYQQKYGIQYPENSTKDQYRELFQTLMEEKNVLIGDIFYRDWENAFMIPAHKMLLEFRKVVIFVGPSIEAADVEQWLRSGFKQLLGIRDSWEVRQWKDTAEGGDVYIVPFEYIPKFVQNKEIVHEYDRSVYLVVLEPSAILAQMQYLLESYAEYLRKMNEQPVYCFADRSMIGLLDTLSHVFHCKVNQVVIERECCQQIFLFLSAKGENEEVREYWGSSLKDSGCGSVYFSEMLKAGVDNIEYVSSGMVPVQDMCWSIKEKITGGLTSQEEKERVEEHFASAKFVKGIWGIEKEEQKCIIVTDDWNHCFDLYWYLSSRGKRSCCLFFLTGDYILFELMCQRIPQMLSVKNVVPVFFPVYQQTIRNRVLSVIRRSLVQKISMQDIEMLFPEWGEYNHIGLLEQLNTSCKQHFRGMPFSKVGQRIEVDDQYLERNAYLWQEVHFTDESGERDTLGCMLDCFFKPRWMSEQFVVRNGCYYQICSVQREIDRQRQGVQRRIINVRLRRSNGYARHVGQYYQYRRYGIQNLQNQRRLHNVSQFCVESCRADITVYVQGWKLERFEAGQDQEQQYRDYRMQNMRRKYYNKELLFIHLKPESVNNSGGQYRFWFGLKNMLIRMSRTLYPEYYPYLDFNVGCSKSSNQEKVIGMYVIEDCVDDLGLLESFGANVERILRLCHEYCK